ncbi:MAG: long-chain fatty acid--CoA ligase [Gemmatimonadota bacterium]|nr:long-chain fatty acid--CoA ligase [Gemmatimonadota bacterium]MDH3367089.1 long-chain fatty acid--CoA ligase [Gemmatimonadota bacterium]MDH3477711.1 long-chain fatty acid--CoA ligase [Gemmatimonadota bacterium]MDH5549284.1 long-chain fatty acid--CoA ligase [Gemmatimonadota bacterium]
MSAPRTLNELFFTAVERFGTKQAALRYKDGDVWKDVTHQEVARRVKHAALGLKELGIRPGERVAILSENRPEWAMADFATLTARCADVPVYPTLPAAQVSYILNDSDARAVFVEGTLQFEKIVAIREATPKLEFVIVFAVAEGMAGPGVLSFQELTQRGAAADGKYPKYREEALAVDPDSLATLIYTSGTTGPPKGVMLTHRNFCSNVHAGLQVLSVGPDDSCLSLLPLSHSFERMAGHYVMFHAGTTISYAESIEKVPVNLGEVKPTVVLSVPRLFEKIYARVLENAMAGGAVKRRIFFWARRNAERWADLKLAGEPIPAVLGVKKAIADRLVFSKLRARTGGRVRFFVSGGAPLNREIAKFFFAAGLPILEGYGLTESSPVITVNPYEALRIGTVGAPIPGVEVKIAPDGEVLARGPNIMKGYHKKPEATAEAIDADGWLHTGDIGELDSAGYLKITDRKKDLIVTASGKNIAPQPIENMIKTNRFVLNAVMIGDKRKFPALLVVPDFDAIAAWANERGLTYADIPSMLALPDVTAKVEREVMGSLRDLASFEMPKKLLLLEEDFTIESGELTPTLKVKRRVVEQRYRARIDALYTE